jgi:hypothetical protein
MHCPLSDDPNKTDISDSGSDDNTLYETDLTNFEEGMPTVKGKIWHWLKRHDLVVIGRIHHKYLTRRDAAEELTYRPKKLLFTTVFKANYGVSYSMPGI